MPLDLPTTTHPTAAKVRRRRATRAAIATVAVVLIATGGIAYARSGSDAGYRTASVENQNVDQILTGVATIEPVSQATVAFPSSGTVATVSVKPGDHVTTGTELATIDPTSLDRAVTQAEAALAQAQLTLERAQESQTTSTSSATSATASEPATTTAQPTTNNEIVAAQQAVIIGQQHVDADLATADQAFASAQQICASVTDTSTTTSTTPSTGSSTTDDTVACQNALATLLTAQEELNVSQVALAQAASHLNALLTQQASAVTPSGGTATPSQSSQSSFPSSNGGQSGGTSAEDLIADQKAVDAAEAQLAAAQQAQRQAAIVTPIDGTVVAVNFAAGDEVTAGSTTATIVITGDGGYEAVTMVKVTDLPKVKVGQPATVTPDGGSTPIAGQVTAIGLVATSGTTTTYPVTIALDRDSNDLRDGATATVEIITSSNNQALAVPTSAVHVNNGQHTVTVIDGGTTKAVNVEVGAVGSTWTAITSGLSAGQTIVIADLDEALPDSATSSSNGQQGNPFGGGRNGGVRIGGAFPAPTN